MKLYDLKTAPSVFEVVWCKWPRREDKMSPGPWVRPVLVLDSVPMVDERDGTEFAAIVGAYGTGLENVDVQELTQGHLVIPENQYRALGLHKATVFKLDVGNRKRLPWAEEYFVPQGYVAGQGIVAGKLDVRQQAIVVSAFKMRGLTFPLPRT